MIEFERPILLLIGLPVAAALAVLWWRAVRIAADVSARHGSDVPAARRRNVARGALRVAAFASVIIAAAGPFWHSAGGGPVAPAHVMFVLDVSASMTARDVAPDRLTAAKECIAQVAELLRGDTVGVVAGASAPVVVCPPTTDRDAFRMLLDRVDDQWTSAAGTQLAPALRASAESWEHAGAESGCVVIVSDGEDHGPDAGEAVDLLRKNGFATHCVCIGGDAPSPVFERDVKGDLLARSDAEGRAVLSRARPDAMKRWAERGGGRFWRISPDARDLPASRQEVVAGTGAMGLRDRSAARDLLPWLCLLAVVLLAADHLLRIISR